ncbi:hypothetical protein FRB94_003943 [Tulasnella sp. JGI-2019a]|nr:hypothetical protein FRB94_003943 [Tulasnella sp. JGI-2019a]
MPSIGQREFDTNLCSIACMLTHLEFPTGIINGHESISSAVFWKREKRLESQFTQYDWGGGLDFALGVIEAVENVDDLAPMNSFTRSL